MASTISFKRCLRVDIIAHVMYVAWPLLAALATLSCSVARADSRSKVQDSRGGLVNAYEAELPRCNKPINLSTNVVTQAPLVQAGDQIVAHVDFHCFAFSLLCKAV